MQQLNSSPTLYPSKNPTLPNSLFFHSPQPTNGEHHFSSSPSSSSSSFTSSSSSSSFFSLFTLPMSLSIPHLGLGYSIAIALAFLFLLSTLLLSSYLCCRHQRNRTAHQTAAASAAEGVILPRVVFVADDDDEGEASVAVGLDQNVINSYPRFEFSRERDLARNNNTTCSICLCEYKDSEMLRMMPDCRHYFHLCCLDSWLKLNGSCPICRNSPLPTPLSTPLQEVVPLSQYAADRRRSR